MVPESFGKKCLENAIIEQYKSLYFDNMSIIVVNNIQGRCIKNTRLSIRQGDKFAMELFSYGMDPILGYLEKRLTGTTNTHPPPVISVLPDLPPMPVPIQHNKNLQINRVHG